MKVLDFGLAKAMAPPVPTPCVPLGPLRAPVGSLIGGHAPTSLGSTAVLAALPAGQLRVLFPGSPSTNRTLTCGGDAQPRVVPASGEVYVPLTAAVPLTCEVRLTCQISRCSGVHSG